jgi:hypothetical protein
MRLYVPLAAFFFLRAASYFFPIFFEECVRCCALINLHVNCGSFDMSVQGHTTASEDSAYLPALYNIGVTCFKDNDVKVGSMCHSYYFELIAFSLVVDSMCCLLTVLDTVWHPHMFQGYSGR